MKAPLGIALLALAALCACASLGPPRKYAAIPEASAEECAITRIALIAVLSEEPFLSKPVDPPLISYIAVTPYLVTDAFDDNPYEALKEQPPLNLASCLGGAVNGPRHRVMGLKYPEQLHNERIIDPQGWISRPVIEGDRAKVLLSRGQCYRTTTIGLVSTSGVWRADTVTHSQPDAVWSGRDPCAPWL